MAEVKRRAHDGWHIELMVPPERHPDAPDWTPEEASQLVQRAAGDQPVTLVDCGADAAATIGMLADRGECDEILLSTPREHHEHWHRHTLPKRLEALGIPVTVIPPDIMSGPTASRRTGWSRVRSVRRRRPLLWKVSPPAVRTSHSASWWDHRAPSTLPAATRTPGHKVPGDWSTGRPNGWTVDRGPYGLVVDSVKVSVFA